MVEQDAAPAGGDTRSHRARAVPGLRPGTLGPPARSWLMVRSPWLCPMLGLIPLKRGWITGFFGKANSRQKRGPAAVKTPRWSAGRRAPVATGAHALSAEARKGIGGTQGVDQDVAPFGAPSPRYFAGARKRTAACPGPHTIRAAKRWLSPKIRLEPRHVRHQMDSRERRRF